MSDVPAGESRAEGISTKEIPSLLLCMIPESADSIAEMYEEPAETAVLAEDAWTRLYRLLADCFTTPVLMPELESRSPDAELLHRCWDFVERIVAHPSELVSGAVYFQVLEQLLNAEGLVEAAWPYMKDRTRTVTLRMLDGYGVYLSGINRR
ncbi:hypothetical protein FSY75_21040 [Streptomyces sp. TR1341]|uniref:Uncharacterized protein n=1 Tax=Streptomyces murinus TaxID=33900 RepID=A0A7W3RKS3_STRMR|nr:hypothetical protein [Streptomyces murinus]MBA9053295.1 hypothetical protein [Streptomyces murinus]NDK26897.1 hypothetical protein [Streptomyces sp. TR1341]UWW94440.1 hypothetical protein GO605_29065 [Streptomyces murinus]